MILLARLRTFAAHHLLGSGDEAANSLPGSVGGSHGFADDLSHARAPSGGDYQSYTVVVRLQ